MNQSHFVATVKSLQDALNAGFQSGEPRPFDNQAFLSRMHSKRAVLPPSPARGRGDGGEGNVNAPYGNLPKTTI